MATQAERDEANAASERVLTFDTRDEALAHIERIAAGWTSVEKPMRSALHAVRICIGSPRVGRWAIEVGAQGLVRENGTLEPTYTDTVDHGHCEHTDAPNVSDPDNCYLCAERYAQAESEHWAKHG